MAKIQSPTKTQIAAVFIYLTLPSNTKWQPKAYKINMFTSLSDRISQRRNIPERWKTQLTSRSRLKIVLQECFSAVERVTSCLMYYSTKLSDVSAVCIIDYYYESRVWWDAEWPIGMQREICVAIHCYDTKAALVIWRMEFFHFAMWQVAPESCHRIR